MVLRLCKVDSEQLAATLKFSVQPVPVAMAVTFGSWQALAPPASMVALFRWLLVPLRAACLVELFQFLPELELPVLLVVQWVCLEASLTLMPAAV